MEKYIDSMRRTIELAETGEEALVHIKVQLLEGYFEQSRELFSDILDAFFQMEKSIALYMDIIPSCQLEVISNDLKSGMEQIVYTYEANGKRDKILNLLDTEVMPRYRIWHEELQHCLYPIILS
ncbi:hypothetical protein [Brevibacillus choshinensis]|uniref:DUF8042 domain-containing protein n=1 Tax=Brevibacillus choshinensis TaxID=54911 RepID=A0ABX7FQN5_BRECH|nr:hypothetical protein [Brevibacillus choshinensis]QRG67315.1 hypothetical protein JNE38_28375 [Brevibacillus choshinensis]